MPISFVHASDLRLGAPLFAVADLPDELRDRIIEARYAAARRVFDLAIDERVDAVVFAGGVLAPAAGPRAMFFFTEQCERLESAGVDVIWSEAESSRRWPEFVPLPKNVALTGPEVGQVHEISRGGRSAAPVMTVAAARGPLPGNADLLRIGILPGADRDELPEFAGADYWALGGRSLPGAIPSAAGLARFSGTTQGGSPVEQGPRGCLLVHASAERRLTSRFIPTASFDWSEECLNVDRDADWETLRSEIMERFHAISRAATSEAVLVRWVVRGHGIVWRQLLREDANAQLLQELRSEFCSITRPVWSLFIEAVPDATESAVISDMDQAEALALAVARRPVLPDRTIGGVDRAHAAGREPHFEQSGERAGRPVVVQR